jgi:hypothetical protein
VVPSALVVQREQDLDARVPRSLPGALPDLGEDRLGLAAIARLEQVGGAGELGVVVGGDLEDSDVRFERQSRSKEDRRCNQRSEDRKVGKSKDRSAGDRSDRKKGLQGGNEVVSCRANRRISGTVVRGSDDPFTRFLYIPSDSARPSARVRTSSS